MSGRNGSGPAAGEDRSSRAADDGRDGGAHGRRYWTRRRGGGSDRGQAFTLEGILGAFVVLTAILFAVQALVGTSTVGGTVDADTRASLRAEAEGILTTWADNERRDLSYAVRFWSSGEQRYYGSIDADTGYGDGTRPREIATLLNEADRAFLSRGYTYNLVVTYRGRPANTSGGNRELPIVSRGPAGTDAVVATHTVTLFDNQTLTSPFATARQLWEYDTNATDGEGGYFPIPDAAPDSPIYNVVEVRLVVW